MNNLSRTIETIVGKKGVEFIESIAFYNMLLDYNGFKENEDLKYIFRTAINDGYMEQIVGAYNSTDDSYELLITKLSNSLSSKYGFDKNKVHLMFQCVLCGLGLIDSNTSGDNLKVAFDVTNPQPLHSNLFSSVPPYEIIDIVSEIEKDNHPLSPTCDSTGKGKFLNHKEPFIKYQYPNVELLTHSFSKKEIDEDEIKEKVNRIASVLHNYDIDINMIKVTPGTNFSLYEIVPTSVRSLSRVRENTNEIIFELALRGTRIISPIAGRGTIGIEISNNDHKVITLYDLLKSPDFEHAQMVLPITLGETVGHHAVVKDLEAIRHIFICGNAGTGKTMLIMSMLISLLFKKHPNEIKLILANPRRTELFGFQSLAPHFMASTFEYEDDPFIFDNTEKLKLTLKSLKFLVDQRYEQLKQAQTTNISEYNRKFIQYKLDIKKDEYLPRIILVIDELYYYLSDDKENEIAKIISYIAQYGHTVGVHMILTTNRLENKFIMSSLLANIPGKIVLNTGNDEKLSKSILNVPDAQNLTVGGDCLFCFESELIRIHGAYVDEDEVTNVCKFISEQQGPIDNYSLPDTDLGKQTGQESRVLDPLFEAAAYAVVQSQFATTSMIQRRFSLGYNRAGHIMDQLQLAGIIGPPIGARPREVYISDIDSLQRQIRQLRGNH